MVITEYETDASQSSELLPMTKLFGRRPVDPTWSTGGDEFTAVAAIGLGGYGSTVIPPLLLVKPGLDDRVIAADSDIKIEQDLAAVRNRLHLGDDGDITSILENKAAYSLLRDASTAGVSQRIMIRSGCLSISARTPPMLPSATT